jgi:hypothetical protein
VWDRMGKQVALEWDRMKPLVMGCEETLNLVEVELEQFFRPAPGSK